MNLVVAVSQDNSFTLAKKYANKLKKEMLLNVCDSCSQCQSYMIITYLVTEVIKWATLQHLLIDNSRPLAYTTTWEQLSEFLSLLFAVIQSQDS